MYILQSGFGIHGEFLRQAAPLHRQWAKRHKHDYICEQLEGPEPHDGRDLCWQKFPPLLRLLNFIPDYEFVLVMDADLLVKDPRKDPQAVVPGGQDGISACQFGGWWSLGFFCVRNLSETRAFLQKLWDEPSKTLDDLPERFQPTIRQWYKLNGWRASDEMSFNCAYYNLTRARLVEGQKELQLEPEYNQVTEIPTVWNWGSRGKEPKGTIVKHWCWCPKPTGLRQMQYEITALKQEGVYE